jgi:hypothetical protein
MQAVIAVKNMGISTKSICRICSSGSTRRTPRIPTAERVWACDSAGVLAHLGDQLKP